MNLLKKAFVTIAVIGLCGCASAPKTAYDPLEPMNRAVFQFNQSVDKAVMKPVAKGYQAVVPEPVQAGVSNFFSNLGDVFNTGNYLLQGRVKQASESLMRVALNTTFGLFGLIDIASRAGLPKQPTDLGQTLGRWGVGSGPYVMLPFLGPSSLRDTVGSGLEMRVDPLSKYDPVVERNRLLGLKWVSRRADLLEAERVFDAASIDQYSQLRDAYLQRRLSQIYEGNPPPDKLLFPEEPMEPESTTASEKPAQDKPTQDKPTQDKPTPEKQEPIPEKSSTSDEH